MKFFSYSDMSGATCSTPSMAIELQPELQRLEVQDESFIKQIYIFFSDLDSRSFRLVGGAKWTTWTWTVGLTTAADEPRSSGRVFSALFE